MTTFLGIDQSLLAMGIAVVDETGKLLHGRRVDPKGMTGTARLAFIRGAVQQTINDYRPAAAAMEGYSFMSNNRSFALGELGGMVQLAFWDAELTFWQIPPKQLKQFVADNADATKETMLRMTREKWKLDFGDEDDICDAHGLARLVRAIHIDDTQYRHELAVVRKILAPPEPKKPRPKSSTKTHL
jgi:Holliday junction resolvasome RuvABC endonuclease subunit